MTRDKDAQLITYYFIARIVLTPPCDMVIRNDVLDTDRILVCDIDNDDIVYSKQTKSKGNVKNTIKNRYKDYYHWLPKGNSFDGGYINFRKVQTYTPKEFAEKYTEIRIKVQERFAKNICHRFSSYYARPGQPDYDFEKETLVILAPKA